jgi:hypothetical protein
MPGVNCKLTLDKSKSFLICRICGLETSFTAPGEHVKMSMCMGGNIIMCVIEWVEIAGSGFAFEGCRKCMRIYDEMALYECPQKEYRLGDEPTMMKCHNEGCHECPNSETSSKIVICRQNQHFRRFKHHTLDVYLSELIDKQLHVDKAVGIYYNYTEKMVLWGLCQETLERKAKLRKTFIGKIARDVKVSLLSPFL